MKSTAKSMKCIGSILVAVILLLSCVSCRFGKDKVLITWFDTDGTLIESRMVSTDYNPIERELPVDSDLWDYTEWEVSQSGNAVICTAQRVAKKHVIWKDYDGSILNEVYIVADAELPLFDLPSSDEKWLYESWDKKTGDNQILLQAKRSPNRNYFVGNVFQIVVKDSRGNPLSSGSGFIINDEGWFITNNHVMDNGYSATAFFDIKDNESGQQYTQLKIIGGVYHDEKKDIFIGKLQGYDKIKDNYNPINFTEKYTEGETAYSVGYPNSTVKMEINSGKILEEYSDIYNKLDGIYYVLSDSYIAPGSSGGILVNENFEVVGITTMGLYSDSTKSNYVSGGSIPYFLFKNNLINLNEKNIKSIYVIY